MDQVTKLRESCLLCVAKHIAQARVLIQESQKGYDHHVVFAIGHLAEAEDESLDMHKDLSELIRDERKRLEDDGDYKINFAALIKLVVTMIDIETAQVIKNLEADFNHLSLEELAAYWNTPQGDSA